MLREIQKSFYARILEILGNGKKRYSEIRDKIANSESGLLDKQLKILLDMETIQKTEPINRRNDKKKQFYEIVDNLMRFYFTFIFGKAGTIARIGEEQFFNRNIDAVLEQFVSRRLEGIALQYFHRAAMLGKYPDIDDFGSYWYNDPATKTNGEFDCVIRRGEQYDFYECKYFDRPMTLEECCQAHIASIHNVKDNPFDAVRLSRDAVISVRQKEFPVINDRKGWTMLRNIRKAAEYGESLGGVIECGTVNVPAGIGSPIFDGLENNIAQLMFGIPGVKGIEFGTGFTSANMLGSQRVSRSECISCARCAWTPKPNLPRSRKKTSLMVLLSRAMTTRGSPKLASS